MRQIILSGLSDSSSKIRTAFAVAVSSIARSDWPDSWPGLLLGLLEMVKVRIGCFFYMIISLYAFL